MNEFETPEVIIINVLDEIRTSFPDEIVKNVHELVEYNEAGLALDILCSQIFEYGIHLSSESSTKLKEAACLMGIPLSQLDGLGDHV